MEPHSNQRKSHLGVVIADLNEISQNPIDEVELEVEVDRLYEIDESRHEPVLRLAEEEVHVAKFSEDAGGVQVSRVTHTYSQPIEELLKREKVEVERVALDQPVDEIPPIREEDDVIIVPVVEEILSVQRRLVLIEEVRIRRIEQIEKYQDEVTLHKQEAVVSRLAPETPLPADEPDATDVR